VNRRALVLRPQPGADRTAARLRALGVTAEVQPLFTIAPVAWQPPAPEDFDALLLTSANAPRLAGPSLATLQNLPVLTVGEATAAAARRVGLEAAMVGDRDVAALLAQARSAGFGRLLHLAGRERVELPDVRQLTVYASDPAPIDAATVRGWSEHVALLHSPRAARRFAALIDSQGVDRSTVDIAAISPAVATAAGGGWARRIAATEPDDGALTALARELIDQPRPRADKQPA
jgi:uroporphyrinogen-III synthase